MSRQALAAPYTLRVNVPGIKPAVPAAPAVDAPSWSIVGTPSTDFGSSIVGAAATGLTLSLKNSGGPGSLATPTFSGANAQDFSAVSNCNNVTKNATCVVNVGFTPSSAGARTAKLSLDTLSQTFTGNGIVDNPNVAFLLHGDGPNNSNSFLDSAGNATFTNAGAYMSTAQAKFGGSSIYLNGSSSLTINSSKLAFGTSDYTIEWWIYYLGDYNGDIYISSGSQPRIRGMGGSVSIFGDNSTTAAAGMNAQTWQHWAVVRTKGVETLYKNGHAVASVPNTTNYTGTNATLGRTVGWGYYITAYIDEMRVSRSAVYTSDFTVPASPF